MPGQQKTVTNVNPNTLSINMQAADKYTFSLPGGHQANIIIQKKNLIFINI
jgi:hypothetical protein